MVAVTVLMFGCLAVLAPVVVVLMLVVVDAVSAVCCGDVVEKREVFAIRSGTEWIPSNALSIRFRHSSTSWSIVSGV